MLIIYYDNADTIYENNYYIFHEIIYILVNWPFYKLLYEITLRGVVHI